MKPFNLEEALAGKPVATRDGRKITAIYHFTESKSIFSVVAHIEKSYSVDLFTVNGKWEEGLDNQIDLFMAEPERWVNIYYSKAQDDVWASDFFQSEQIAKEHIVSTDSYQTTIKIRI